jgi:hypothetical protein
MNSGSILPPLGTSMFLVCKAVLNAGVLPSLTIGIQWSHDGGTTWADGDPVTDQRFSAFGALTASATRVKEFAIAGTLYRITFDISGVGANYTITMSEYTTV